MTREIINLDCMSITELREFSRKTLIPRGRTEATLHRYANLKEAAMFHRSVGSITEAVKLEAQCDEVYKLLPKAARW